jgi:hypothetical protein
MPKTIYHWETNSSEEWLTVNEDGSVTHHVEGSGWSMKGTGPLGRDTTFTATEAKNEWPKHAEAIEKALEGISSGNK